MRKGCLKNRLYRGGRSAPVHWSSSDRTNSPFLHMDQDDDYKHRTTLHNRETREMDWLWRLRHFSLRCRLEIMDRPLDYCWFMSFPSTWLEQVDIEVRLCQAHSKPRARVLLGAKYRDVCGSSVQKRSILCWCRRFLLGLLLRSLVLARPDAASLFLL